MVADGAEYQRELPWQIVEVQRAYTRQVGPQISVDPRTLDAYESTQVQTGPGWIWERTQGIRLIKDGKSVASESIVSL